MDLLIGLCQTGPQERGREGGRYDVLSILLDKEAEERERSEVGQDDLNLPIGFSFWSRSRGS